MQYATTTSQKQCFNTVAKELNNSLQSDQNFPLPPFPSRSERASLGAACRQTKVAAKTHRVKQ